MVKKSKGKTKKIISKIISGIMAALLVFLVCIAFYSFNQLSKGKAPTILGYSIYYVATNSMNPAIKAGEVILCKAVSNESELQKGDIITFKGADGSDQEGKTITHRIVSEGVVDGYVTTCGDANYGIEDPAIPFENVKSEYIKKLSFLSFLYSIVLSGVGFTLLIIIPPVVLLSMQVVRLRGYYKIEEKEKKQQEEEKIYSDKVKAIAEQAVNEYKIEMEQKAQAERDKEVNKIASFEKDQNDGGENNQNKD